MKKYIYPFLLISFALVLFSSCKKEPVDYREKYCGEWNFVTEYYYSNIIPNDDENTIDSIFNYQGSVWYDSLGKINIEYRENYIITVKVSLSGEITDNIIYDNETAKGEFINQDSLFLDLRSNGHNYAITQFIYGKKIE